MNSFLKCDAPGCDHLETHGSLCESMVGKPCPKCGANLLTADDYAAWLAFLPQYEAMKAAGILLDAPADTPREQCVTFRHHDGRMHVSFPHGA